MTDPSRLLYEENNRRAHALGRAEAHYEWVINAADDPVHNANPCLGETVTITLSAWQIGRMRSWLAEQQADREQVPA